MGKPISISLALTGARYSPWLKPNGGVRITPELDFFAEHMPITPEAVTTDVLDGYKAGATFFHAHARNPETGAQYANLGWYQQTARLIREINPHIMLSYPTSRKMEVGKQIETALDELEESQGVSPGLYDRAYQELKIRAIGVEARPDTLTTFTVPEVKILGKPRDSRGVEEVPGWSDPDVMQLYYHSLIQRTKELGVMQEIEITTMGQFDVLKQMAESGNYHLDAPIHFVILLGFSNGLPIDKKTYEEALIKIEDLRRGIDQPTVISVGAVIRPKEANEWFSEPAKKGNHDYIEVMQWVASDPRVNIFRVGLEDTPKLYRHQLTNPGLVSHAVQFFNGHGRDVITDPKVLRAAFAVSTVGEIPSSEKKPPDLEPPEESRSPSTQRIKDNDDALRLGKQLAELINNLFPPYTREESYFTLP